MKKQIILIALLLPFLAVGQGKKKPKNLPKYDYKKLHFGFTLGFNKMDFLLHPSSEFLYKDTDTTYYVSFITGVEAQAGNGIHLGPISNFRISEYFDARLLINMSFGSRTLKYSLTPNKPGGLNWADTDSVMKIESIYLEFPLLLKYKSVRINNYRPYLIGGINPKIDLAARKKVNQQQDGPKLTMGAMDVYGELGIGIDYYLPYFKLSTELKFGYGIFNMRNPIKGHPSYWQYSDAINSIHSKVWMISFHFE